MQERSRVLFVSRRNSLRSVIAEMCLNHLDNQRFAAYSCGAPRSIAEAFHPAAIDALRAAGMPAPTGRPRSWESLLRGTSARCDFVITLDERLAAEAPRWPGQPDLATWSLADIAADFHGDEAMRGAIQILHALRRRLELLISLPLRGSDRAAIRSDLRDLAHLR